LSFYCLSFFDSWLLITPLVSSDYPFGIFWLPIWYLLITPLVSSDYPFRILWLPLSYILITPLVSSDYAFGIFWLPLWYLLIMPLVSSNYSYSIFPSVFLLISCVYICSNLELIVCNYIHQFVWFSFFYAGLLCNMGKFV
jgi:hypothetical protein